MFPLLSQQPLQLLKVRTKRHFCCKILLFEGLLQVALKGKVLVWTGNLLRCQDKPLHQKIPGQGTPQSIICRQMAIAGGLELSPGQRGDQNIFPLKEQPVFHPPVLARDNYGQKTGPSRQQCYVLHWSASWSAMVPRNGLGQEIFFLCWLFRCGWDQLVTDTWTHVCQFMALVWRLEQNDWSVTQVPLSKSLCWRRMYSEGISGVVSVTKAFHLFAAGKLSRLRCKTEGLLICADHTHSQELFLPLVLVSPQGRLILAYSLAKKLKQPLKAWSCQEAL